MLYAFSEKKSLASHANSDILGYMRPIEYIREHVFGATQGEMAAIAGVSQSTISRWESGVAVPTDRWERIRAEAMGRGLDWDDSLIFIVPQVEAAQ